MIKKLFNRTPEGISIQVFRYVIAGTIAYAIDYSSLIIFTEIFKIHYLTSSAIAFLLGMMTSYVLNVFWVFDKRTFDNRFIEFFIFMLLGIVGLVLNQYCIWFFTENANLYYLYSKGIATFVVFILNFFGRKYLLFR